LYSLSNFAQSVDEYTLKAIWIGKFTHFIDWPSDIDKPENLTIATIGEDPFEGRLEDLYDDHKIWDKPVDIVHLKNLNDSIDAHILYIPPKKLEQVSEIIEESKNKGILIIGDCEGYAEIGVHINFYIEENKVKFEINESAIRNSEFFISYRLLNIAKIIEPLAIEQK
jgi:hypothetical protein